MKAKNTISAFSGTYPYSVARGGEDGFAKGRPENQPFLAGNDGFAKTDQVETTYQALIFS
ncbi:hypothetical protein [Ellagibacter isourolithinifaciens]|uniref:hypothetical protein n=1 Tax=Ellagibacter isourolithinifaciens TaxID=2137581 RepID=UPI003AB30810|nr:hypothetical protein [Ellagibacter isourolithinifaciens]